MKLAERATEMIENNNDQRSSISNASSPEEIAEYWDSHSLADHWDQTHEADFEVRAPRRITIEPDVYARLQEQAETTGVPLATLANSWLKERLTDDKAA
jgi:hypothetical protein